MHVLFLVFVLFVFLDWDIIYLRNCRIMLHHHCLLSIIVNPWHMAFIVCIPHLISLSCMHWAVIGYGPHVLLLYMNLHHTPCYLHFSRITWDALGKGWQLLITGSFVNNLQLILVLFVIGIKLELRCTYMWWDQAKWVGTHIDLEIGPNEGNKPFNFLLFWWPFNRS